MLMYQSVQGVEKIPFPANTKSFEYSHNFTEALGNFLQINYPDRVHFKRDVIYFFVGDVEYEDTFRNYKHTCTDLCLIFKNNSESVYLTRFSFLDYEILDGFVHPQVNHNYSPFITDFKSESCCMGQHLEHSNAIKMFNREGKNVYLKSYIYFYENYLKMVGSAPYIKNVKDLTKKFIGENSNHRGCKDSFLKDLLKLNLLKDFVSSLDFNFKKNNYNSLIPIVELTKNNKDVFIEYAFYLYKKRNHLNITFDDVFTEEHNKEFRLYLYNFLTTNLGTHYVPSNNICNNRDIDKVNDNLYKFKRLNLECPIYISVTSHSQSEHEVFEQLFPFFLDDAFKNF